MLLLVDFYIFSLMSENIIDLECPGDFAKIIEKFRKYETSELNEHEISRLRGLNTFDIRSLKRTYCEFLNYQLPKIYNMIDILLRKGKLVLLILKIK